MSNYFKKINIEQNQYTWGRFSDKDTEMFSQCQTKDNNNRRDNFIIIF